MTRAQLEHAIRAACAVCSDHELYIFGSQAILGTVPDAPPLLRASIEVDLQPKNHPEAIDRIDGALGELSLFHSTHHFYVHGVSIASATLPDGWQDRTIPVCTPATDGNTGHCLELHDLAASKLVAFRPKDLQFVATMLIEGLLDPPTLFGRIDGLAIDGKHRARMSSWFDGTLRDL